MFVARSRLLSAVTPSSVPPALVKTSSAPPLAEYVPFLMVPLERFHEPVAVFNASVVPVLSRVPTRFTVPPLRVNVPRLATVKEPPRFTVLSLALMRPALLQAFDDEL